MTDHAGRTRDDGTSHRAPGASPSAACAPRRARAEPASGSSWLVPTLYILFLMVPIYWLLNMSFKTTNEILGGFTLWPHNFTLANYHEILTNPVWYNGYINSIIYVTINTLISVTAALPAAYAFSRYRFLGDKHLFFWLLTNRMAPPAVFALPFFQLYSAMGLFDTHIAVALAHCLFNIPLAVWILEGFMSGVPKEIDETAYIDGYSFPRFFVKIFMPLIASRHRRRRLLLLHVLLGGAAARQDADVGRGEADRRGDDAHGERVRLRARPARRRRRADHHPRRGRHLFRAQLHRQGLRPGEGVMEHSVFDLTWMAWTWQTATFFVVIVAAALRHDGLGVRRRPAGRRGTACSASTRRAATGCSSRCSAAPSFILLGSGSSARTCGGLSASRSSTPSRCSDGCEAFGEGRPPAGIWKKGRNTS